MIRRDYILRMIEECIRALARISSLKQDQRWNEAATTLDGELQRLIGSSAREITHLSETDLLARLMGDGPTHALREKTLILTALLKEAGDLAATENRMGESSQCYLNALHLLLDVLAPGDAFEFPEFIPKVEVLRQALQGTPLPSRTYAMLMQHYEQTGEFAKAEDALFALLDTEQDNNVIVELGIAFYQRLLALSDAALKEANLPRAEVEEGLKELQGRGR